jgi:transposase-like protein
MNNYENAVEKFRLTYDNPKNFKTYDIEENSLIQTYLNGKLCPHCKSRHVVSNGNYKGRKKYKCKECKKNFNDLTGTPFGGIHKLDKMKKYIDCMIKGKSIRESGKEVSIAVSTSFKWRHKVLSKIDKLQNIKLKEVVEVEEVKTKYSAKGQRKKIPKSKKNSIISMIFSCDESLKVQSNKIVNSHKLDNPILKRYRQPSERQHLLLCSSKAIFKELKSTAKNVHLLNPKSMQHNNISNLIIKWNNWMQRFHGVATDYLHNYLHWFDFLQNARNKPNISNTLISIVMHHQRI